MPTHFRGKKSVPPILTITHTMSTAVENLWNLTTGKPEISPAALGAAISACLQERDLDFRTRLLIRDSVNALNLHWSRERLNDWLNSVPNRRALEEVRGSDLGPTGFPSLGCRLMEPIQAETVRQFLRELGANLRQPTRLEIGGAIALILTGNLSRSTEDIDVVNEVPAEIRSQHELLARLQNRYGIHLTHFQSHFLPTGWEMRLASAGRFGNVDAFVVDPYDIFVGKLFSARDKDFDDLRVLARHFDKMNIAARLRDAAKAMLSESNLAANAERNWYILYGEALPR